MAGAGKSLEVGSRVESGIALARVHLFTGRRRLWIVSAIIALLAWPIGFGVAGTGLDLSWMSGLYMGVHNGKDFGIEVVFTYGPLGFLAWPILFYSWLAVLALLFSAIVYFAFAFTMTALLERTVGLLGAAVIVFLYLVTVPDLEQLPLILAVAWALGALREDRTDGAVTILAIGGGTLSAFELLIKLSVGPIILLICLVAMIAARASRREWGLFAGFAVGGFLVLWLVAGQSLGSLWDYGVNGFQVVTGYNEAMGLEGAPTWFKVGLPLFALGLVIVAACAPFGDRRRRIGATLLVAIAAFSSYKYGIVRFEPAHLSLGLSAMLGIWLVMPWRRSLVPAFLVATVVLAGVALHIYPGEPRLDPWHNVQAFGETAELVLRPGLRQQTINESRAGLQATYALDPETLAALKDKEIQVDPWEIAVTWAYELDWHPLPVIQNYTAYTQKLDRLNSEAVEDADTGPQVILRQNPGGQSPLAGSRSFEGRMGAWDPPEQNFETVCNFIPVHTTEAWQVLERVPNRCGPEKLISETEANAGESVQIPKAHRGELVLMDVEGVKIEGFEKLRSLLWRPRVRIASLNEGLEVVRLVPDTAEDGLVVSRDPRIDSTDGFEQLPEVENLKIEGISNHLHFKFYSVPVKVEKKPGS
jgi:hypothetical protein